MRPPSNLGKWFVTGQFGLLGLLLVLPSGGLPWDRTPYPQLAGAATGLAVLIGAWAFASLRGSFRVRPEPLDSAQLVQVGIYRYLRHPMYVAVLLVAASMTIHARSWAGVGTWCALLLVLRAKARFEDTLWRERDPRAAAYQRQVGAFLPRLRRPSS